MSLKKFCERAGNSPLTRGIKALYQSAIFLSGVIILLAMVAMVLLRYVFHMNLFGMDEIILCFVFWFYFFGGVNGSMEDSQIRADVVSVMIKSEKVKWGLRIFTRLIEIGVLCFLVAMSIGLFLTNCQRMPTTQGLKIPYIIPQFAIVVGFLLMLLYTVGHLLTQIADGPAPAKGKEPL